MGKLSVNLCGIELDNPVIPASGTFGFPKDRVLRIAMDSIGEFLVDHLMKVYIVLYDKESTAIGFKLFWMSRSILTITT